MRKACRPFLLRASLSSALGAVSLLAAEPCHTEPTATDRAVELAYQGRAQFEAGHYREALTLFEQAVSSAKSPVFDLYIARCHRALGEWLRALEYYERTLNAHHDPENSAWTSAQRSAAAERDELAAMLPRLTITAPRVVGGKKPTIQLDSAPLDWPVSARPLDPGKHLIVARHLGQEETREVLSVAGERLTIELSFSDLQESPPLAAKAPPEARDDKEGTSLSPWFWGSATLAGVGLTAGVVTGILAFTTASEVRSYCEESGCPGNVPPDRDMQDMSELSRTLGDVSTVSFIAAGAFTTAAVTFLLLPREPAAKKRARTQVQPLLTGFSLRSEF